jgi:hypothetical protein
MMWFVTPQDVAPPVDETLVWVPASDATDTEQHQEINFDDGWRLALADRQDGWGWELLDEDFVLASGHSLWEGGAKNAALKAYGKLV